MKDLKVINCATSGASLDGFMEHEIIELKEGTKNIAFKKDEILYYSDDELCLSDAYIGCKAKGNLEALVFKFVKTLHKAIDCVLKSEEASYGGTFCMSIVDDPLYNDSKDWKRVLFYGLSDTLSEGGYNVKTHEFTIFFYEEYREGLLKNEHLWKELGEYIHKIIAGFNNISISCLSFVCMSQASSYDRDDEEEYPFEEVHVGFKRFRVSAAIECGLSDDSEDWEEYLDKLVDKGKVDKNSKEFEYGVEYNGEYSVAFFY